MRTVGSISDKQLASLRSVYVGLAEDETALAEMGLQEWAAGLESS